MTQASEHEDGQELTVSPDALKQLVGALKKGGWFDLLRQDMTADEMEAALLREALGDRAAPIAPKGPPTVHQSVDALIDADRIEDCYDLMRQHPNVTFDAQHQRLRALGKNLTRGAGVTIKQQIVPRPPRSAVPVGPPPLTRIGIKVIPTMPSAQQIQALAAQGKRVVVSANGIEIVDQEAKKP